MGQIARTSKYKFPIMRDDRYQVLRARLLDADKAAAINSPKRTRKLQTGRVAPGTTLQ